MQNQQAPQQIPQQPPQQMQQQQQPPQQMQQPQQQMPPQQMQQQQAPQGQPQMPMQPMMGMPPMPGMGGMPGMPMAMPNAEPEAIRNLMINYIPSTIDETQLRQLFEMYGPAESVKIVKDRETKASKGYGFVKYRFSMSALHATQYLNGYPLMNKRLKVSYANHEEAQKVVASYTQMPMANFAVPPRA